MCLQPNEVEAYRNMVKQFGSAGKTLAVVSDSYDIYHAVSALWGEQLKEEVREEPTRGTLIPRGCVRCIFHVTVLSLHCVC